ncbi:MAG: hypothetical protein IJX47_08960 [Clostridia bacterium]|nr:hypothetical protein [Clostridia bacterium]
MDFVLWAFVIGLNIVSNTVEKNFSGFVKVIIDATTLLAMGAVVADGALIKGFHEGAKVIKSAMADQDAKTDDAPDEAEETTDEETSEEKTET